MLLYTSEAIQSCHKGEIWQVQCCAQAWMPLPTMDLWVSACWSSLTPIAAVGCALRDQDQGLPIYEFLPMKIMSFCHQQDDKFVIKSQFIVNI